MSTNNNEFFRMESIDFADDIVSNELIGNVKIGNIDYAYFKNEIQTGISKGSYFYMVCKMSIPPSFYHLNNNFDPLSQPISTSYSDAWFITNIIPETYFKEQVGIATTTQKFTFEYYIEGRVTPLSCGRPSGGKDGECRASLRHFGGRLNKVFCTKNDAELGSYYIPMVGKSVKEDENYFSKIVYFKVETKAKLMKWLEKAINIKRGIGIDGDAEIKSEVIDNVEIKVTSDPLKVGYRDGCNIKIERMF